MAENAIVSYDPSKLMDAVRDRIKAEFVGLIPEDAWKQMVKAEVDRFFKTEDMYSYGYSDRKALPSQFQRVVWDTLQEDTKARVKAFLESPEWSGEWDGNGQRKAGEAVKKIVVEKSGEIVASLLANAMQQTIEAARQRI
jgi:hypothetical protein